MPLNKALKDNKNKYQNPIPTTMASFSEMPAILKRYWNADSKNRKPSGLIPVIQMDPKILDYPPSEDIQIYWMGHTSLLLETGGRRYLLDPVLSERASMSQSIGPKRMHPSPIAINDLKNIDAVILSHDHYDHLDYHVMKALSKTGTLFYVPVGVGKILQGWGCNRENIFELNWWDEINDGANKLIATPARHFSGRGLTNRNTTLWCSWCIINTKNRIYFGGDSGIMPQYEDIGNEFGPFDLTIMPIGAYDEAWHDIHIFPFEAVDAHIKLKGKKMLPVHWATFNLAFHPWSEPIEQLLNEADKKGIELITPIVGEQITIDYKSKSKWWNFDN